MSPAVKAVCDVVFLLLHLVLVGCG
jgi:hypothetical protein